jgi:hypothetical protein
MASRNHHHWLDNPVWVLAFFKSFLHSFLFNAKFFQLFSPKSLISWYTLSPHLNLGLQAAFKRPGLIQGQYIPLSKSFDLLPFRFKKVRPAVAFSDLVTICFLRSGGVSPMPSPQSGRPDLRIYVPRRQGGSPIPPGTGFSF